MAKNSVGEWDAIPANNSDIGGIGIIGSSAVSNFDDAIRTMMSQIRATYLGFTPVQQGTGIGQSGNVVKIGWNGFFPKMTVDTADLGRIWTDSETAKSRVANGYEKLPSGLVLQWGTSAVSLAEYNLSLPIAFLNSCFGVWASVGYPGGAYPANYAYTVGIDGFNTVGFTIRKRLSTPGNVAMASDGVNIQWFALGY